MFHEEEELQHLDQAQKKKKIMEQRRLLNNTIINISLTYLHTI